MLAKQSDPHLRAYVVWVPKVGGQEKDVPEATRVLPDERATHYWDETGQLMRTYAQVVGLTRDAWDIYFLYGSDARWDGELPPTPRFWMHQLGGQEEPVMEGRYLDVPVFADSANRMLERYP